MKPITQENDRLEFYREWLYGPADRGEAVLESAFKLRAYDRDHSKTEELIQYGGKAGQSTSELSSNCDVVFALICSLQQVPSTTDRHFSTPRCLSFRRRSWH